MRRARRLNPGGHALAAQCRQSRARNQLGAERGSAQSLVGIDDGRRAGGQRESIRFFCAPAPARGFVGAHRRPAAGDCADTLRHGEMGVAAFNTVDVGEDLGRDFVAILGSPPLWRQTCEAMVGQRTLGFMERGPRDPKTSATSLMGRLST